MSSGTAGPGDAEQVEAIAAAMLRRQPWYAKPYAYVVTMTLAVGLPLVCPKLPEPAQPVCEFVHGVAHALVQGGPPATSTSDDASRTTSSATDGG